MDTETHQMLHSNNIATVLRLKAKNSQLWCNKAVWFGFISEKQNRFFFLRTDARNKGWQSRVSKVDFTLLHISCTLCEGVAACQSSVSILSTTTLLTETHGNRSQRSLVDEEMCTVNAHTVRSTNIQSSFNLPVSSITTLPLSETKTSSPLLNKGPVHT